MSVEIGAKRNIRQKWDFWPQLEFCLWSGFVFQPKRYAVDIQPELEDATFSIRSTAANIHTATMAKTTTSPTQGILQPVS